MKSLREFSVHNLGKTCWQWWSCARGTCKANPPGDLGGEEVWVGGLAAGLRVHLRLAQEEAAGGAGLAPVGHLGSLPWPNTDHLSISRGTFLCPQPAPPTLTLRAW